MSDDPRVGIYSPDASPLHATRAAVGATWCFTLATVVLAFEHPLILAALAVAIVGAGIGARAGGTLLRAARFGIPLALLIAAINPLIVRDGLTVIFRFGEIPPFGQVDLTLEALAYGAVLGMRALLVMLAVALMAASVNPDELLALFRRISFRSAVTAALATRLIPVLARDASRLSAAQQCRPDAAEASTTAARVAVLRAVTASALDRAVDVAATLEVRGYGSARRPPRGAGRPWSRHDVAFTASAVGLAALALGAWVAGIARFEAYPELEIPLGPAEWALAVALVVVTLLPFADRRGIAP